MRKGYGIHSVCHSVWHFFISGLKCQYNLSDDLSPFIVLFENQSYYGEKASGTSAVP